MDDRIRAPQTDEVKNKVIRLYGKGGQHIRLSVDEMIARELNSFEGWRCSAGARNLYVDFDGDVWIANCASAASNGEKGAGKEADFGARGNIVDGVNLDPRWVTCPFGYCGCGADVTLAKVKTDEDKEKLVVNREGDGEPPESTYADEIDGFRAMETDFPLSHQILWDISRRCNYSCSYCWPDVHNKTDSHLDFEVIKNFVEQVTREWSGGRPIRWLLAGGEPTLHPRFIEWMQLLKEMGHWTLVTSNGSRPPKYWEKLVPYLNTVLLSAHFESLNEEKFLKNIEIIANYHLEHSDDHWLEVKLMTPPGWMDHALRFRERIQEMGVIGQKGQDGRLKSTMSLVPIRSIEDHTRLVRYADWELEVFQEQGL